MDSYDPQPPPGPIPPQFPPPAPPQTERRGGGGWMILSLILFGLLLLVSVLWLTSSISRLLGSGTSLANSGRDNLQEVRVERASSPHKIALIRVEGLITASGPTRHNMVTSIADQLDRAAADQDVKAVVLRVDSPGGEVLASDDINVAVQKFQKESGKPVVASMGSLAASGGYYVSAPCRWIVANPLTITGSIGVIMSGYNYRGLMDKVGVKPEVYKSGMFKDMLRGSKLPEEISDAERDMVQDLVNETYQRFKEVVEEGRARAAEKNEEEGKSLVPTWAEYADGRILSGKQAFALGFVDELGNLDTAISRAKDLAGVESASLIEYQQLFDLSNLFSLFGKTEATRLQLDIGIDFPKLQTGCLYFLSPTFVR